MKFGTIIRLPDEEEATVVYHGLEGYGVVMGRQTVQPEDGIHATHMLREPSLSERWGIPCIGTEFEIVQ